MALLHYYQWDPNDGEEEILGRMVQSRYSLYNPGTRMEQELSVIADLNGLKSSQVLRSNFGRAVAVDAENKVIAVLEEDNAGVVIGTFEEGILWVENNSEESQYVLHKFSFEGYKRIELKDAHWHDSQILIGKWLVPMNDMHYVAID